LAWARKAGARSAEGTDSSLVHVWLTRWNLQYVQETGQIPEHALQNARVIHGGGFASMTPGDRYLINFPSVRGEEEHEKVISRYRSRMHQKSNFMPAEKFLALFETLEDLLKQNPSVRAIVRLMFMDNTLATATMDDVREHPYTRW
jgi:hypothetical protein